MRLPTRPLVALALAFLIWLVAVPVEAQEFVLPDNLAGKTVLYVGAHPDDEWGVVPILAEACLIRGARCHFLVVADGPGYGCLLTIKLRDPVECSKRRRAEMREAAGFFRGGVEFLGFDDLFYAFTDVGMNQTIDEWSARNGGRNAMVQRIRKVVQRERPSLIFTFDPRHGSSCHPGHRAAATLLVEAVRSIPARKRPAVWLEQTLDFPERVPSRADVIDAMGYVPWPETLGEVRYYDATKRLPTGLTGYDYVVAERRIHATQVPDEASGKFIPNPPPEWRKVPLVQLTDQVAGDFCTQLDLQRPTLDKPENRKRFGIE